MSTKPNSSPMASAHSSPRAVNPGGARVGAEPAKARGVEHPIPEDAALIGDTRHELHTKSLPRKAGPNYGLGNSGLGGSDQFRVEAGDGVHGE